jgi:hypothetical protein
MKPPFRIFLGGMAGVAILAAAPVAPPAGPVVGRILVLDNDKLIEGEIRRAGEAYSIRRNGGETIVPAGRVVDVVANRKDALRSVRERANLRDPDERLRLVRWCLENGLRDEALVEAEELVKFRPDARTRDLVAGLREMRISPPKPAVAPPPATAPDRVVEVEPPDYNREAYPGFVSKVQPILMNTCASCHVGGQGGNFTLVRVTDGGRKATLVNLAAVLRQIDRKDPAASPLLVKAVTPHGKATRAPLHDHQSPAYQNLEAWVSQAVILDELPAPSLATPKLEGGPKPEPKKGPATRFGETSTSQAKPEPQTEAKDPFDPAIFNGTIQPKQ